MKFFEARLNGEWYRVLVHLQITPCLPAPNRTPAVESVNIPNSQYLEEWMGTCHHRHRNCDASLALVIFPEIIFDICVFVTLAFVYSQFLQVIQLPVYPLFIVWNRNEPPSLAQQAQCRDSGGWPMIQLTGFLQVPPLLSPQSTQPWVDARLSCAPLAVGT
ncbi:hypothetical protein F5888DRAFT_1637150 [Russula emetica]|nr:hypothetical protein F5888DRAFT_1637150 [Russula emetica]